MQFYSLETCMGLVLLLPLRLADGSEVAHFSWSGEFVQESQDVLAFEKLARDYCYRLAKAGEGEGEEILFQLQSEPGRSIKARTAVGLLGRLGDGFDWWLLSRVFEWDYDPAALSENY